MERSSSLGDLGLPPPLPVPAMYNTTRTDSIFDPATKNWIDSNAMNKTWLTQVAMMADINKDFTERQKAADEVLDGFDGVSPSFSSPEVTQRVIFLMYRTVTSIPPFFVQEEPANIFRKTILRLIHRLATLDVSKSLHDTLIPQIISVMEVENEENGIICMKTLIEVVKVNRPINPPSPIFSNMAFITMVVKLCRRWMTLPRFIERVYEMCNFKPVQNAAGGVDIQASADTITCSIVINNSLTGLEEPSGNPVVLLPKTSASLKFLGESVMLVMFAQSHMKARLEEAYPTIWPDSMALVSAEIDVKRMEQFLEELKDKPSELSRVQGAYHEYMVTYCKVPQLFAYVMRHFGKTPEDYSVFGKCVIRLLSDCPREIVWGRREIFGAIKHMSSSSPEWRLGLIPYVPQLLDLDFLLGSSQGCKEVLKSTAVSVAMDLLHFVRGQLSLSTFDKVINLCISYFSDRTLGIPVHIILLRTMSTNLSENIIQIARDERNLEDGRLIFLRVLNMLGLRLKVMVKYSLQVYRSKLKGAVAQGTVLEASELMDNSMHSLSDQRAFLRAIVNAVRTFLYCVKECSGEGQPFLRPEDLKILTRICKYCVQATELFIIGSSGPGAKPLVPQAGKPLEKDFTENLADTMKTFPFDVYRDIFQHMFWRFLDLFKDEQLQQILTAVLNCLIPYTGFSGITTTTMLDVGVARFPELAEASNEVSLSVLKIFKILFGAVSLYPKEVEQYFKPLLAKIFHQGFSLCMRARDPYNLLLMFRAFFRAMGGGGHEVLYQDFLPNLPMILQVLCTFHSQRQKPAFKEIFIELCLIVPVRLSTLMPHISLLAPAILTAMQGSPSSSSQGLRTLELCIDNMSNDYLYEQLEPVKKELMKALWGIMMNGSGQMQTTALRFLGKMCGHALKAIREPQQLHPKLIDDDLGPCLVTTMPSMLDPLHVPIYRVIEEAYKTLLETTTDLNTRNAAWSIVQSYLLGILRPDPSGQALESLLQHPGFKQTGKTGGYCVVTSLNCDTPYVKCTDEKNRLATQTCLQGLMVAAATKDFRNAAMPLFAKFVRHFSLMAVLQQSGVFSKPETVGNRGFHSDAIDPFVVIDAIIVVLGLEEPAISRTGDAGIILLLETLKAVYEDLKYCVTLPFLNYLFEKLHSLCYEKAWCCKAGALTGISPLIDYMPLSWTVENSVLLTRALIFVLRDGFQSMTYGIIDVTKKLLDKILRRVLSPLDLDSLPQDLQTLRLQAIQEIIREFILSCTCVVEDVRTQAMEGLILLSEILNQPLGKMLEPHQKLIAEFVPPKRPSTKVDIKAPVSSMKSYQMTHQMALLEANRFFLNITPTVASYDQNKPEDMDVIHEILEFLKLEDEPLQQKYQCFDFRQYYPVSFLPYRIAAFRFVTVFANFRAVAPAIHQVLFDTLTTGSDELLEVAAECLTKFASETQVGRATVTEFLTATKTKLEVPAAFSKDLTDRLVRLQSVYPDLFEEDFATLTFNALPLNLDTAVLEQKEIPHICDGVKKCALMMTLLSKTAKEPQKFIQQLIDLTVQTEEALMTRNGRVLTAALAGVLKGHGPMVIDLFFQDSRVLQSRWISFFEKLLKGKDDLAAELKTHLTTDKLPLLAKLIVFPEDTDHYWQSLSVGIRILYFLAKKDTKWLIANPHIIDLLRSVWCNTAFNQRLRNIVGQHHDTWELSVKFLVLLMVHVRTHCDDLDALFEMTRHSSRAIAEGSRWRQFVECHMIMSLTPVTRRTMVLKWLAMVRNKVDSEEYLTDICDLVIQPIVKQQFIQGQADQMVNDPSTTDGSTSPNPSENLIFLAGQMLLVEDPQLIYRMTESLRVACLKLLVLFTEQMDSHFPEAKNGQNNMTQKLSTLAVTLILKKDRDHVQIDVGTIYQAQNLLAQISARGQVPSRYVPGVTRSLFYGQMEARSSNKAAMDILLPNLLTKNADSAVLFCTNLRKVVTDDTMNITQIAVVFQAVVRHRQHFYPYRQQFVQLMWNSTQKLALNSTTTLDLKRTAVDIVECLISWEATRRGIEVDYSETTDAATGLVVPPKPAKLVKRLVPLAAGKDEKALEQKMVDGMAGVLLRLVFVFGDAATPDSQGRRCFKILKFIMRKDMYPNTDLKMQWMADRLPLVIEQIQNLVVLPPKSALGQPDAPQSTPAPPNPVPMVCLALEILTYFIPIVPRVVALNVIQEVSVSLIKITMCFNARVARCMNSLIAVLCQLWPGDPVTRNNPAQLDSLYSQLIKVIHEGLNEFERVSPGPQTHIFCTLMLLKATIPFVPSILDRFLTLVANAAKKIMDEHLGVGKGGTNQPLVQTPQDGVVSAELVVVVLDVIKVPAFFTSNNGQPSHRQTIIGIMNDLITRSADVRVHRALIRIFNEWLSNPDRDREPSTSGVGGGQGGTNKTLTPKSPRKPKKKAFDDDCSNEPESASFDNQQKKKKKQPKQAGFIDANLPPMPPQLTLSDDIQTVTPKELSSLILKLQIQIERKFVDDNELQTLYTNLILKIFSQDDPKMQDLQQRLINAYMYGLRHPDPDMRKKFYLIHDRHFIPNLQERLNALFTGISWDMCNLTYYIGFCINNVLGIAANKEATMTSSLHNVKLILPVSTPASEPLVSQHRETGERRFSGLSESVSDTFDNGSPEISSDEPPRLKELSVATIVERVGKLNDMTKNTTVRNFLDGLFQLCHARNQLANDVWILLLPQIWKLLSGEQRDVLVTNFRSYLMSQSHQAQRDLVHFPIQAMWDAMNKCEGIKLKLQPMAVLFLGERQNLWYRSAIHLEDMAIPTPSAQPSQKGGNKATQQGSQQQPSDGDSSAGINQLMRGVLWSSEESLQKMYSTLGEEDFSTAVWQIRGLLGPKAETIVSKPMLEFKAALGYERQGLYYDAKESYEKAMDAFLAEHRDKSAHESEFGELQILSERYADVLKQLNQWPALYNVAMNEAVSNPCLALEAAWHQNSFEVIPGLLQSADKQCPPKEELNFGFCKAYNSLHKVLQEGLNSSPNAYKDEGVDRLIDCLQQVCIKMWRHLPKTGTLAHRPLIEMATRVSDLKELLTILPALHSAQACQTQHVVLLKNMVKNWKLRVPGTADDLRFWGEITDLRSQVLTHVINLSSEVQHHQACSPDVASNLSTFPILSIHTISQNYFQFSKAARMQQVPKFSLEILSRVQTLPVVPLIDCFERVKNHVMACLALFEQSNQPSDLQSALVALEGVTMTYFTKEMYADLTALRSQVCIKMMKVDEGHKLIAAAVQMFENCNEGWLRFGDYYEMLFQKTPVDLTLAKQAVVAYIFGSRSSCDSVARECCAKMIALLNSDDSSGTISSAFEEAVSIIPHTVLVFWVPQLIHLMMREETSQAACTLLTHVAKQNPQPVYLHVRTYFYQMKALDRSKDSKSPMGASISSPSPDTKPVPKRRRQTRDSAPPPVEDSKGDADSAGGDGTTIRASSFLKNCVTIMKAVSESQPTICNALESFANQIFSITMSPDRWYEELHAYLNLALKRCYALAYENRERVMQAKMTPFMIQYVNTIVRSFGTGVYQEPGGIATSTSKGIYGDVASEAITRRAQSLQGSSDYNKLKKDFFKEFDCSDPENLMLQTMLNKLKKWVRNFEKIIKTHSTHSYLDANHRPLTNFTNLTADMELPGDHSMQRNQNVIKVVQILPRMDVVIKHNLVCRRLYFINNVGDTIPYLIIADNANNVQGRKEERILQLFMALNPILDEFPEASRRALKFYVPKITPVAPAVRLMEDSQASVCLFDIYRKYCDKKNIDADGPVIKFYEKLVAHLHRSQGAGSSQLVLRDCLKEIQMSQVQSRVLRDHFWKMYPSADEYFLFRKTFIRSHAAICVAEHILRLTKLTPDMMHIHTENGVEGVYSYTFDLDERNGELVSARAVPFRLTPNLTEIFTCYGVTGPLQQSMVAAARAFKQYEQKFKANVKTIFWDELTYWMVFQKEMSQSVAFSEAVILSDRTDTGPTVAATPNTAEPHLPSLMLKGVKKMLSDLQEISQFNGHDSAALKLIAMAKSPDNLCRMDPSWHPWL